MPTTRSARKPPFSRWLLAGFFIAAGVNHFRDPAFYLPAMPPWLPWHQQLIDVSGAAEIVGGVGVLIPATRRAAGWSLIALLVAVFPANVYMALSVVDPERRTATWLLWARLPVQAVLVAWVWWSTRGAKATGD